MIKFLLILGDGELGFDDFHDLMREKIILGVQEDDLQEAFDAFDTDGDGYITPAELQKSFIKLGENMTMDEALEVMEEINTNTDGLVDFGGKNVPFRYIFIFEC